MASRTSGTLRATATSMREAQPSRPRRPGRVAGAPGNAAPYPSDATAPTSSSTADALGWKRTDACSVA